MARTSLAFALIVSALLVACGSAVARVPWSWTHVKMHFAEMSRSEEGGTSAAGKELRTVDHRYPLRDTPHHAIEKLEATYEAIDLSAYMDCLSDTLIALPHPGDLAGNPSWPSSWGAILESSIHETMFGPVGEVYSITLFLQEVLPPLEIPSPNPGDPSSWELVYIYDLWVWTNGSSSYLATGGATLKLSVDPHETGPAGEELWEIAVWADHEHVESATMPASWGSIKALYR